MKKRFALIVVFIILVSVFLSSCSKKAKISESVYNSAVLIVDIIDSYLEDEIEIEEAKFYIQIRLDDLNEHCAPDGTEEYYYDLSTSMKAISLQSTLLLYSMHASTRNDLIESRNELAKYIGERIISDNH